MSTLRSILPALSLSMALAGVSAHADAQTASTAAAAAATGAAGPGHHWRGHRGGGEFRHVLHKLNLTPDQQTQIKAIFAQAKPQLQALHTSSRQNREALMSMAPSDAKYPALIEAEKANAAARVQQASDVKTQIYAVLRSDQLSQIPGIVATDQAARAARIAAWRAKHTQS